MTFEDFARFLNTKSMGRIEPVVNEQLTERVYTGMKRIGSDTMPIRWLVSDPDGYEIMRRVDAFTYIRYPVKPVIGNGEHLDLEESLVDALALYVVAGLELSRSKVLMGMYYKEIDTYNDKLTETFLAEATNDAERFYTYP